VFYTGCNVLKTPHMALLALDIMDALGVTYNVMGGPTHCCGVVQLRTGDTEVWIALHKHPGVKGVVGAGTALLRMVPGIEIVDLGQPAVGLMSNSLNALPDYKRGLQLAELDAAAAAGVDALVAIFHVDHRELCAHER